MDKILHFIPVWIKFYISGMFFIGFGVFGMVNKRGGGRTTAYGERKKRWWSYCIRRKKKGERRKKKVVVELLHTEKEKAVAKPPLKNNFQSSGQPSAVHLIGRWMSMAAPFCVAL